MPLCLIFIQVDSAVVLCQVLLVLPFTAADDFCREVSRSYGAKEAFSLQSVSLLEPGRVESGLRLFPVSSFRL